MIAALFSVLLIASDGAAATAATPPAPVATEAAEADKKICKRQPVTGQIQGTKRVCMTADQWKRAQEANQRRR
jgi:hypothetical protein